MRWCDGCIVEEIGTVELWQEHVEILPGTLLHCSLCLLLQI